jgi:hypothetical protein
MIDKKKLLPELKSKLEEAKLVKATYDKYISEMRNIYEGKVVKESKKPGSSYVAREVFKQVEWYVSQLKNPFISNDEIVRLSAKAVQLEPFTQQSEKLLNYMFTKNFNRYNFITDLLKVLAIEGTAIVRTGWEYEGQEMELEEPVHTQMPDGSMQQVGSVRVTKEISLINRPTATVVKNNDIFLDPTATSQEDLSFLVHKREVRLSDLKEQGIYESLDKVEAELALDTNPSPTNKYSHDINANLSINLDDKNEKKIYMYEFWGNQDTDNDGISESIVCCWINDTIVRLEENPYPDNKIPYIIINYIKEPFSIWGKSLADLIKDQQRVKTGIMRGIFDDIAQSNSGQMGVQKGNLDAINLKRFYEGKPFEFNLSPNAFFQKQYNRIPGEVFKVMQDIDMDIQVTSGVVPMQGGLGSQSIYGSQAGKSGQLNSMALRELDQVINIADNCLKPLFKKWLQYMYDLLDPEEVMLITKMQYVDPKQIPNYIQFADFEIDISTQHTDEMKASELAFLLQTLGNNMPMEMTKLIMGKIAELKQMPELAQQVQQYQPQPDPYEQQLKQLEIAKLQAEIEAIKMNTKVESEYKESKADEAKAKTNLMQMDSMSKKYGVDFNQKMQELQAKHQMELEKLKQQAMLQQQYKLPSNIGISSPKEEPMLNGTENKDLKII